MSGGFHVGGGWCNASSSLSSPGKGTTVTSGHNAYGSWAQIIASTPNDAVWACVRIWPTNFSSFRTFTQIGVGGAGSETVLFADLFATSGTNGFQFVEYWFPCAIPAGTRIAARSNNNAAAEPNNVQITLYDGAFMQIEAAGVDSMGYTAATATAVDVDPGSVANTYGSWIQIIASTARDYKGLGIALGCNSSNTGPNPSLQPCLVQIAIGAAGGEVVLVRDYEHCGQYNLSTAPMVPFIPLEIPAGVRLSARCASADTTASNRVVGVMLYGVY